MTALLDNGHYDALRALLQAEQDPVERATLFGALISTSAVLKRLADRSELGALVAYARKEANAEARRRFLLRLLPNHLAVNALLDQGHYDALLALADGEESRAVRMTLLGACYSNVRIVERLVETGQLGKALRFVQQDADENCRRQVLEGLCQNDRALHAVVSQGQFDTLLNLVRGDDNQPARGMMLGALLASPRVLPALLKRNETEKFFAAIRGEEDDDVRRQVLQRIFAQGEPVLVLLEQGRSDGVLELVRLDPNASARGQLFAQLLIRPEAIQRLTAAKQLDAILSFARGLDAVEARRSFLQQLYSQGPTVAALLEHGRFDALWKLASGETDARWQAILLGHLVANAKTVEYLVVNKQTDLLLQLFLTAQGDLQLRRNFLRQVVTSETAVSALIQHGQFDQLIQLMASSSAAGDNSGLLAELLLSVPAIERLAHSGKLPPSVQAALGGPDAGQRGQFLDRLVANPRVVAALAEKGQLETLYQAVTADATPARRRQLFGSLLASSQGVQQLVATKRLDEALTQIGEEPDTGRRLSCLQRILYDASALQALLAAGRGERLLDLLPGSVREPGNASLLQAFLSNPAALRQLNAAGQFDNLLKRVQEAPDPEPRRRLVDGLLAADAGRRLLAEPRIAAGLVTLLKAEPLETTRGTHVRTALTSRCVWQSLVYSGQADRLREIAALLPDQAYATAQLRRMLCSPSGLVAYHLSRGEEPQARQLLEQAADDDWGRVRLAAHLAAGGAIDQRLAELQRRLEQKPEAADARLLTYLARAKGDWATTRRAAELTKDEGLLKAVLVEQRAWAEAGRRQAAGPCPLPIPAVERPARNPVWLHVEQLSLTAAYQRLAGQAAARDKTLAELQRLAEKPPLDKEVRWMCVEALLLNDRVAEGVALLAKTMPARAFEVLCYQQRYREALELFGWRDGAAQDPAWLENLPTVAAQHEAERVVQRVDIALHVARTLHTLGRRDDVAQLLVRIEAFVQQQPDDNSSSPLRRQCWERLSGALAAMGMTPRAWDYAARAVVGPDAAAPVLARLYARRLGEAEAWWSYFRQQAPADSVAATLQRVDRVLNPPPEEDAAEFDRLAAAAEKVAESGNPRLWQALAEACLRRGRLDVAGRAVAAVRAADSVLPEDLAWQWADALRNAQRWPEAAEQYAALWQANHDVLAALYLAGDAAEHAGRAAEGRKQKDLAHRLALDSQRRRELAVSLLTHGLRQEAVAQLQLVLRTAPCEHWEWNDAARCLGDELAESDPATAADLLQHSLLDDLRWNFYLLEPYDYVRTPAAIHRLRAKAAVASGDFAAADREIELTLAAVPCDTHVAEDLVPLLEKAARRPQAEALFERLHTAFRQRLEQYPQCALLHNNLAWLSARCHRRLAEALQHARQANELVPNNAAYLDTLAEAQFRLGDRDAAIRHSRRAVQLRPQDESLKKQLARFERDPLP
jgi:tetratricopeptide (TPR) repeat protein